MNNEIGIQNNFIKISAGFYKPRQLLKAGETFIMELRRGCFLKVLMISEVLKFSLYVRLPW